MVLDSLDWLIIGLFFMMSLSIGVYFTKKASENITNFFLGGRNMTWWLAGVSMVATTFAADTPLAVTELVARNGIAGNWLWWNALLGGMLTVFFFSKLWRRAEILTDVELIELRYSGKAAAFLRGFRSVYLGLFMNCLVIGWVNLALVSILTVFFNISASDALVYVGGAMVFTVIYSSLAGLLGVAVTDFVQFFIAMGGCIALAIFVLDAPEVGGITGLKEKLPDWSLDFFPKIGEKTDINGATLTLSIGTFLAFTTMQWWASWYPGAEPGGGGYIAQRMMSTKNEKHAIVSTLFFQIAHYCLRPWPWIIVGLASLILYPELSETDKKLGFVMAMRDFLPSGMKGLLLVAFFSAYMSTISTQLNWGASYLVNDFFIRFISRKADQKKLILVSRITTVLIMICSLILTTQLETISGVWYFIIEASAGLGLTLILRWYWWRVNAWSEIVATIAPLLALTFIKMVTWADTFGLLHEYSALHQFAKWLMISPNSFFMILGVTTIAWLTATFLTSPTDMSTLISFYRRVRPQGTWGPVIKATGEAPAKGNILALVFCWLSAIVMAYSMLFLFGKLIFREWGDVFLYAVIALVSGTILMLISRKIKIFED